MKFYGFLLLTAALGILNPTISLANDFEVRSVSDVQSMVLRVDGKYDVVCKNGSTEVVTAEQIKEDKVCGGGCPQPGPEIEAVFSRPQGDFFALCKNKSWDVATAKMIQEGKVCKAPLPNTIVSDGSKTKPHCSWASTCKWDTSAQAECAQKLCESSGYSSGMFVSASNDPCTASFTNDSIWAWKLDEKVYFQAYYQSEAQITASCK